MAGRVKHNYPQNWDEISRRIRYERAQGKCEWCSAPDRTYIQRLKEDPFVWKESSEDFEGDREWTKASFIFLTVSHYDHDTTHNEDSNLNALCNRCHLKHDALYHAANARRTRIRKRAEAAQAAGQLSLFEVAKHG